MEKLIIRKAKKRDFNEIYFLISILEEIELDKDSFKKFFLKNLKDKNIFYKVAVIDKKVIGFISLHIHKHLHHASQVGEIVELIISSDYRNKEIGKKLLLEVEKIATKKKCTVIEVTSNKKRVLAHHFYEKNGYQNTHFKLTKNIY